MCVCVCVCERERESFFECKYTERYFPFCMGIWSAWSRQFSKAESKTPFSKHFRTKPVFPPSSASPLICKGGGEKTKKASKTSSLPPAIVGKKRFSQQGEKEKEDGEEGDQKDAADLMPLVEEEEEEEDSSHNPFPPIFISRLLVLKNFSSFSQQSQKTFFSERTDLGKDEEQKKKRNLFSSFSSLRPLFNPSSFFSPQIEARDQLNYFDSALPPAFAHKAQMIWNFNSSQAGKEEEEKQILGNVNACMGDTLFFWIQQNNTTIFFGGECTRLRIWLPLSLQRRRRRRLNF